MSGGDGSTVNLAAILAVLPPVVSVRPTPERAFMFPWAEEAYEDIEDLEAEVAARLVEGDDMCRSVTIGEYTVRDRRSHLTDAASLVDMIEEGAWDNEAGENVEYGCSPVVLALAEALMIRMSEEGAGWMVDKQVAEHVITLDGLQPMLDGEPWGDPLPEPPREIADLTAYDPETSPLGTEAAK